MASVKCRVVIDQKALEDAAFKAAGTRAALGEATSRIASRANSLGSGFRTGTYHDHATGETRGDTQPAYSGDVRMGRKGWVGIVHPENYAAMKDTKENNTLLKAKG